MISNNTSQETNASSLSSSIPDNTKGGFVIDGIEKINSRFKCKLCSRIIRDAIQLTACGHRLCRDCFETQAASTNDENIRCPYDDCDEDTKKTEIMFDKAFQKELDALRVGCMFIENKECTWTGLLKDYQTHLEANHIHYNCPACHKSFPTRATLDAHSKICSDIFSECRLGTLCTEDMIPKNEFLNHQLSEKHQETVAKFLGGEYHIPEPSSSSSSASNQEQENQLNKALETKISKKLNDLSAEVETKLASVAQSENVSGTVYQHYTVTTQELNNLQMTLNERLSIKQNIQPFQEQLQKDIEQTYERCNNTEHISMDGTLTWRITDVSEKMSDAQSERQTSIYSPIFYSSANGYRMRARLFLFGDGNARRTHISLFFLLMKGEYDSILKWPFNYKVTFCLLDQTGNNRHIIDSFYPDVKSSSFQRPREAANTASGIPKFFPLPMLLQDDNAYVRENILYIKIIIALNETMPKSILPFMLTLNPALPNYVQENLLNQEAAKQQTNTASSS